MALGMMVDGQWMTDWNERDESGKFNRTPTQFRDRVTAGGRFQPVTNRYRHWSSET
jgi:putative glutathione S-transferase